MPSCLLGRCFISPQLDTAYTAIPTDMGLLHCVVCLFVPQILLEFVEDGQSAVG